MKRKVNNKMICKFVGAWCFITVLTACNSDAPDLAPMATETSDTEAMKCYGYDTIPGAYCGYTEQNPSPVKLDWELELSQYQYPGDFAYLELDGFKQISETSFVPTKKAACEVCSERDAAKESFDYAGDICECESLSDELYYIDSQTLLELFNDRGVLKDSDVMIFPANCYPQLADIGIAYSKTLLYQALSADLTFYPIPDCYPDLAFINQLGKYKSETISKTITDKNGRNHSFEILTIECDDAYFIQIDITTGGGSIFAYTEKPNAD